MATQSVSLSAVLLKSLSLMISHCSLHFFLLLVPHAFKLSTVFYPALLKAVAKPVRQILFLTTPPPPTTSQPQNTQSAIFGLVVFLALDIIPYLWVVGSATNSALRGLQGLPAAVNSGRSWVLPLVFTRVLSLMQIASSSSLFRLLLDLMVPVIGPYFTAFLGLFFLMVLQNRDLMWSLAPAVVVAESKLGQDALERSSGLVRQRGLKRVVRCLVGFYVFATWGLGILWMKSEGAVNLLRSWALGLLASFLLLWYTVAVTVLYCIACEGDEEADGDVKLPIEDDDEG
ncbi:hypothetical protein PRUPE_3G230800 [Prunus persica]|uniref:Transmembrane protein n=1 Tax=Prunus persica TaxID=3760 RepID=A0A251Q4D8_PRUPE|nr:uncharacterized protein LOC109947821 [Prunus persica]ONI18658.1 hypothetical protein PRUPE_3G230800 [Prunus persica]